jgi:hypothetical protein
MAKTKISEFDLTPANNTDIDGINIAEGCAPSGINNAIRELMSQLKAQQDGSSGDPFTITGTLTASTVVASGGSINNTTIGASTASTGRFTTLSASGATTFSGATVFSSTTTFSGATVMSSTLTANTFSSSGATITGGSISGITDLAVADGGTGASSITANSVILGNGSSALSGNLVAPSTSGYALRSNGTTWTSQRLGLGMTGEVWNGVTGSRALGQSYTNNNGYPIMVVIAFSYPAGGSNTIIFYTNAQELHRESGNSTTDTADSVSFIVPSGATYSTSVTAGTINLVNWAELY